MEILYLIFQLFTEKKNLENISFQGGFSITILFIGEMKHNEVLCPCVNH